MSLSRRLTLRMCAKCDTARRDVAGCALDHGRTFRAFTSTLGTSAAKSK